MAEFELMVNGAKRQLEAAPEMPLLWALRDILGLQGTKFGCGAGLCGACTVHVDGVATRSCSIAVSEVAHQHIRTIEGLGGGSLHSLQKAWLSHNVPQCGYCQSGQLMSAAALLDQNPNPTEADINAFMAGNLCRCGTYPRIKAAIQSVVAQGNNHIGDSK